MFDPGGPESDAILLVMKNALIGREPTLTAAMTEAQVSLNGRTVWVKKCLLDTGAAQASYGGKKIFQKLGITKFEPCSHRVRLGDGKTRVEITERAVCDVALYDDQQVLSESIPTSFYVMPELGEELIIGLPDILTDYYYFFMSMMEKARGTALCAVKAEKAEEKPLQDHAPGSIHYPWTALRETGPEEVSHVRV